MALSTGSPIARSSFLDVDGLRLHVLAWDAGAGGYVAPKGQRPPLLFLHGGMAHGRWWEPLAPLVAHRLRPFALDRRGHGDSDWTEPERYGWERDLCDIEAAMRALDPGPWIVAGHSQGGLLAAHLALRGRAPLAAIVLLDVPLHPSGSRLRRTGASLAKVPQLRYPTLDHALRGFKPFPPRHRVPPDVLEAIGRTSFKRTADGDWTSKFHWQMFRRDRSGEADPLADFADRLAGLPVPALCLRGSESPILTRDEHAEMAARIPRAEAVEIAEATHNLHAEQPEQVAHAIVDFLARVLPA